MKSMRSEWTVSFCMKSLKYGIAMQGEYLKFPGIFHLKWALCVLSERCQCDSHVSVCIMPMIYGFSWDL
ncbi:hypothetical protein H704_00931 [Bartonella bacilliformis Peru38]|nr:hypothetical protein H704_00931 [Bartonella bacilliformis Peru38]